MCIHILILYVYIFYIIIYQYNINWSEFTIFKNQLHHKILLICTVYTNCVDWIKNIQIFLALHPSILNTHGSILEM